MTKDSDVQTDPDTCLTKKYNEEREKREKLEIDIQQLSNKIEQLKENSASLDFILPSYILVNKLAFLRFKPTNYFWKNCNF